MNWKILLIPLLVMAFILPSVLVQDADAARFGGGRSFGSRPSMSQPAMQPQTMRPMTNQATAQNVKKPGLLGGMGGMLGGLLAGTLLGSLLFGGGFHGGGFLDILLLGLLAFLAFKFFAARRAKTAPAGAGGASPSMERSQDTPFQATSAYQASPDAGAASGTGWDAFRSTPQTVPPAPAVPAGFDVEEFLRGAKLAFTRLQESWDRRDLNDIAQFVGPAVLAEVKSQFSQDPNPGRTEILLVNAQLSGVREEGDEQIASVYFDALLREAPAVENTQVREVWHFIRPLHGNQSWKLDGIQQVVE